jgi:hypothetical protein
LTSVARCGWELEAMRLHRPHQHIADPERESACRSQGRVGETPAGITVAKAHRPQDRLADGNRDDQRRSGRELAMQLADTPGPARVVAGLRLDVHTQHWIAGADYVRHGAVAIGRAQAMGPHQGSREMGAPAIVMGRRDADDRTADTDVDEAEVAECRQRAPQHAIGQVENCDRMRRGESRHGSNTVITLRERDKLMNPPQLPEVWLRGAVDGYAPLLMPVVHALLQVREDLHRLAETVPAEHVWARPGGAASIGFHLRHTGGALDRLLTYARGDALTDDQKRALRGEEEAGEPLADVVRGVDARIDAALAQVRATDPATLLDARTVGRAALPATTLGLIFHAAEHSTRHLGQAITTARILTGR